jgi:amidohydrolase
MELKSAIRELADQNHDLFVSMRRHLHAHPELSFQEHLTAKWIASQLSSMGISFEQGVAGTGLVAKIEGSGTSGKTIALRADIDALPILEANQVDYRSKNEGVMHACGHDVHTSSLLGVAKILLELRPYFGGTVRFLFQPGEEKIPGGASLMIKAGALEQPRPQSIFGQHVMPQLPVGKVGFRSGRYMASTDELYLKIIGRGGHGAMPEQNIDPVMISAHILVGLQQLISRMANPKIPSVLSFGKVVANGATNIIPNEVWLEGTFRTMNEPWRNEAHEKMRKMVELMAESMGGRAELEIRKGYPVLENDPALTQRAKHWAEDYLGKEQVVELDLWMAAEDFAYYTQVLPGCFYRLGTRNEAKGIVAPVHTPNFDIDEEALKIGAGLMAFLALKELESSD